MLGYVMSLVVGSRGGDGWTLVLEELCRCLEHLRAYFDLCERGNLAVSQVFSDLEVNC